jgi:hypothetical protein
VRIRGAARKAYYVDAPTNIVGVEGYYVFYLMPAGGPTSPIMVYSLELPPGFPQVDEKNDAGEMTDLNEEVEFVGYFYKRTAYQAIDGTRVAPLLIAKSPDWTPRETRAETVLPDWRIAVAVAICLALLSAGIAVWVYMRHRGSPLEAYPTSARAALPQLGGLDKERILPSPGEALAELARRQSDPTNPSDN